MTVVPSASASGGIGGFEDHDIGFAIGSLFGIRCWEIAEHRDSLVFRGQYGGVWGDGENVAVCPAGHDSPPWKSPPRGAPGCSCTEAPISWATGQGQHHWDCPLQARCGCGFWGYWTLDAAPQFNPSRCVVGVIEGYGRVLRGPKGFRCAKARIVGIHLAMQILDERGAEHANSALILTRFEMALAETYPSVPAYATREGLFAMHPPTLDYLPESQRPKPYRRPEPDPSPTPRSAAAAFLGTRNSSVEFGFGTPPAAWPGRIIRA